VEQAGGGNSSEINPDQRGNTVGRVKKPATESTSAQGIAKREEVYFPDQNCKSAGFYHFLQNPGYSPRDHTFRDSTNPGISTREEQKGPETR